MIRNFSNGKNNSKGQRILVIDDDPDILELLRYNLNLEGYKVRVLADGRQAVKECLSFKPKLVIVDIMMPHQDGMETCRQLRSIPGQEHMYIMFLTARSEEYSEVAAFNIGADDYVIKPIRPRALIQRINKALSPHPTIDEKKIIKTGSLTIDGGSYSIIESGKRFDMPKKEFELLFFLARNPAKIFSRDSLLNEIWGYDVEIFSRTVDVHIRKIREKIGKDYIQTIKGVGYKFAGN